MEPFDVPGCGDPTIVLVEGPSNVERLHVLIGWQGQRSTPSVSRAAKRLGGLQRSPEHLGSGLSQAVGFRGPCKKGILVEKPPPSGKKKGQVGKWTSGQADGEVGKWGSGERGYSGVSAKAVPSFGRRGCLHLGDAERGGSRQRQLENAVISKCPPWRSKGKQKKERLYKNWH